MLDEKAFRTGVEVICGTLPPRYREYAEQYRDHLLHEAPVPEEFNLIQCPNIRAMIDAIHAISQMQLKQHMGTNGSLPCPVCGGSGKL